MLHRRLPRPAAVLALVAFAALLSGCDMSMMAWSPQNTSAQKPRGASVSKLADAKRAVAAPACEYHLGSGDTLGEKSFAIYCDEALVAQAPDR